MTTTLYGIPASHPVFAAELMLGRKGVPYRRLDLPQVIHKPLMRALRFPATTVPALVLDGRRIQTTRAIARALEELRPDPPLLPADPERRARVEAIEAWCDGDFQQLDRRVVYWALLRHHEAVPSYFEGARVLMPRVLIKPLAPPVIRVAAKIQGSVADAVRADLAALPGLLDRIDGWIAEGLLGGEEPNVADYQVASTLALLMTLDDLRPIVSPRPAGELVRRHAAGYPGRMPPTFPKAWLPVT